MNYYLRNKKWDATRAFLDIQASNIYVHAEFNCSNSAPGGVSSYQVEPVWFARQNPSSLETACRLTATICQKMATSLSDSWNIGSPPSLSKFSYDDAPVSLQVGSKQFKVWRG